MSKATGVVARATALLKGVKAPWAFTGPVSSPEYLTHLTTPDNYRRHAPASPPVTAYVPHAEPEHVYDIAYYTRDTRRSHLGGGKDEIAAYAYESTAPDAELEAQVGPALPNETFRWKGKFIPITEQENNGYTL